MLNYHDDSDFIQRQKDSVKEVVHDYINLVHFGRMTQEGHPFPVNHAVQHAFLVECRKFAGFFLNRRAKGHNDMMAKEFVSKRFKPELPEWENWRPHMNKHLMHLSYDRLATITPWDGSANKALLEEMEREWPKFINALNPLYEQLFAEELKRRAV